MCAITWLNLEDIILNNRSPRKKRNTIQFYSFVFLGAVIFTQRESRLVVMRDWGLEEMGCNV